MRTFHPSELSIHQKLSVNKQNLNHTSDKSDTEENDLGNNRVTSETLEELGPISSP